MMPFFLNFVRDLAATFGIDMKLANRYEYDPKNDRIGKGGFGTVYKAFDHKEKKIVALKFVQKSKLPERYSLFEEIGRIHHLNHPNLIKYLEVFKKDYKNIAGEEDEMQVGVMEYANGGDLSELMKKGISEHNIKHILVGILEGLAYLHENKMIHRDIKPQNILLLNEKGLSTPKITDFSVSKHIQSEMTSVSSVVGTYEYMSPEQLGSDNSKLGVATDIWSFGVLTYQILTGELPFGSRWKGISDGQIIANIVNLEKKADLSKLEEPYQSLVQKCLQKKPEQRFQSVKEILAILQEKKDTVSESFYQSENISQSKEVPTILPEIETRINEQKFFVSEDKSIQKTEESYLMENALSQSEIINLENVLADDSESSALQKRKRNPELIAFFTIFLLLTLVVVAYFAFNHYSQNEKISLNKDTIEEENLKRKNNNETVENQELNQANKNLKDSLKQAETIENKDSKSKEINKTANSINQDKILKQGTQPKKTENKSPDNKTTQIKNVVVKPSVKYDYEEETALGKIVAQKGKYGFIDLSGKMIIPLKYEDFAAFNEGLAAVKSKGKWGFIDMKDRLVIPYRYDAPGIFFEGTAEVRQGGKSFFINTKGVCVKNCK